MPNAEERRLPQWPLRLALSLIMVVEALFVILLTGERDAGNISMIVNSVGLLVLCVFTWRGIPWSRWLLVAFLVWRLVQIGVDMSSHFDLGDHRIGGSLMLVMFYVRGLTHKQIAAFLQVPEGTVKRRLFDTRRSLQDDVGIPEEISINREKVRGFLKAFRNALKEKNGN